MTTSCRHSHLFLSRVTHPNSPGLVQRTACTNVITYYEISQYLEHISHIRCPPLAFRSRRPLGSYGAFSGQIGFAPRTLNCEAIPVRVCLRDAPCRQHRINQHIACPETALSYIRVRFERSRLVYRRAVVTCDHESNASPTSARMYGFLAPSYTTWPTKPCEEHQVGTRGQNSGNRRE